MFLNPCFLYLPHKIPASLFAFVALMGLQVNLLTLTFLTVVACPRYCIRSTHIKRVSFLLGDVAPQMTPGQEERGNVWTV